MEEVLLKFYKSFPFLNANKRLFYGGPYHPIPLLEKDPTTEINYIPPQLVLTV
jgi:hypothetical protein